MKRCILLTLAMLFLFAGAGCSQPRIDENDAEQLHVAGGESTSDENANASEPTARYFINASDAVQADFFTGLSELGQLTALNGGEVKRISSKNAAATKVIDIDGETYEAEYQWTETDSGDPEGENVLFRYGSYDHYKLTTDAFTVVLDYLSGTDMLAGYVFEPADETGYEDVEIDLDEARNVFKGFVADTMKYDLSKYSAIREIEDSDGSYCFIYSVETEGIPTNDTIVVGVARSGYIYGVSAKEAGISGYFAQPSIEKVESGINSILEYMHEKLGDKAEDTGTRSICFGNDGKIYAAVKFASKSGPDDLATAFTVYTQI